MVIILSSYSKLFIPNLKVLLKETLIIDYNIADYVCLGYYHAQ